MIHKDGDDYIELPIDGKVLNQVNKNLKYYCQRCSPFKNIGILDKIVSHIIEEHPKYITDLQNMLPLHEFLFCKCRIFINVASNGIIEKKNVLIKNFYLY